LFQFDERLNKNHDLTVFLYYINPDVMKNRTKDFALEIMKLTEALPKTSNARIISNQIVRCGTSVASNYRSSCRARSKIEFIAKLGIVEEEADETLFWLELIEESEMLPSNYLQDVKQEANEITAIVVTSRKSARANKT
jgi:four helix bundle protein